MQCLLIKDIFDKFLINEGNITTSNTFHFDGRINSSFFDKEELDSMTEDFIYWKNIKHICFEIIRGKKVPTHMKLVFSFPKNSYPRIINECGISNLTPQDIGGLYLHINYDNNHITAITGTSLNLFSMDKTLDRYWDDLMKKFLDSHFEIE